MFQFSGNTKMLWVTSAFQYHDIAKPDIISSWKSKPGGLKSIERTWLGECPERTGFLFLFFAKQNFTASDMCLHKGSVLSKHFFFHVKNFVEKCLTGISPGAYISYIHWIMHDLKIRFYNFLILTEWTAEIIDLTENSSSINIPCASNILPLLF